jgi:hypothetical protein
LSSIFFTEAKILSKIRAAHLILDFLNEQDISEAEYVKAFEMMFNFIWLSAFYRTVSQKSRMLLMEATIELYEKYKYKHAIDKAEPELVPYLRCGDPIGLYTYVLKLSEQTKTYIKLFNLIPFIRIRKYPNRTKISVFGIPILGIYPQPNNDLKYNG